MFKKAQLKLCQIEDFEHVGLNRAFLSVTTYTVESNLVTKGNNIKLKLLEMTTYRICYLLKPVL
jgi:hypothetical protein